MQPEAIGGAPIRAFLKRRRYDHNGWDFYINSADLYATAEKRDGGGYTVRRYASRFYSGRQLKAAKTLPQAIEIVKDDFSAMHPIYQPRKIVSRSSLSSLRMSSGFENKVDLVIDGAFLKRWVGIGWTDQRIATPEDYELYPVCVDDEFDGIMEAA